MHVYSKIITSKSQFNDLLLRLLLKRLARKWFWLITTQNKITLQQHYKSTYNETHITVATRKPKLQKCLTIFKPATEGGFFQTSIKKQTLCDKLKNVPYLVQGVSVKSIK